MIGIYKITNKNNGKVYIGLSDNIERRLAEHKKKKTETIDDYINVLGVENFEFDILEECSKEELDSKELEYIDLYDSKNNGYNIQSGGFNNSSGEGNGRARVTEQDVKFIRENYNKHVKPNQLYQEYFKDKITKSQFQTIWQGKSWTYIMPEVYTEENKKYYTTELCKNNTSLTPAEVLKYRKYYINHSAVETYNYFVSEKGDILKYNTFYKILSGDVRKNSIYNEVPLYKKKTHTWELNNEPVSTISESGE